MSLKYEPSSADRGVPKVVLQLLDDALRDHLHLHLSRLGVHRGSP